MPKLELGMISSTWAGTKIGIEEGIRKTKEIGFDTYDIFQDPLDIDDASVAPIEWSEPEHDVVVDDGVDGRVG